MKITTRIRDKEGTETIRTRAIRWRRDENIRPCCTLLRTRRRNGCNNAKPSIRCLSVHRCCLYFIDEKYFPRLGICNDGLIGRGLFINHETCYVPLTITTCMLQCPYVSISLSCISFYRVFLGTGRNRMDSVFTTVVHAVDAFVSLQNCILEKVR